LVDVVAGAAGAAASPPTTNIVASDPAIRVRHDPLMDVSSARKPEGFSRPDRRPK
jgi:hypothetical protein